MDALERESDSPKSIIRELSERRRVSSLSPRSPREEAGPLKGSPVSVRLRPGVRPSCLDPAPATEPCLTARQAADRPVADLVDARPIGSGDRIKRLIPLWLSFASLR